MHRTLTVYGWLLCFWQPDLRCSACTRQTTAVANSDHWRIPTSFTGNAFHMIERALENMEDNMVTLPFPPTATTSASPSASVVRPRRGETVTFRCPLPVGGHSARISWTVQGRTVFERGQPLAPHPHYEFAQLDDGTAVLRIRNVSLQFCGEVICLLDAAARTTVLRRFTLIPRATRVAEVFAESLPRNQEAVTGAPST
ncbi:uncharacterized protein LOC129593140 isoform X2 [Paramacrobiotus metropolitanus]|uniref:uncharacterized protein LOC129593140 isoform X2 n=1 Tax=Paramacrobiotus metropolitanus TaxID=2943436 RepID=UPI002445EE96|nr:uncharacterized protein LOC129593140 isoform X2 [Paramacrobiotus metropolitanus]